jgi:hypothetical protein
LASVTNPRSRPTARLHDRSKKEEFEVGRPTIAELEAILESEEEVEIVILPNGEIRAQGQATAEELGGRKPLTMREDLGGEYGGRRS